MQYAILCYHDEKVTCAWSKEEDDAVMAKLGVVMERLTKRGKLGPVARLLPTTAASTLRKDREPGIVIDGPFAETKEQLLGFYIVDCASLDEALDIARELGVANPGGAQPRAVSTSSSCSRISSMHRPSPPAVRWVRLHDEYKSLGPQAQCCA